MNAAKKVWGLCERICSGDIKRRKKLYDYLVRSVMSYGAEIWGWSERKELESIQNKYYRWTLGLEYCTPAYVIKKELKIDRMAEKWGKQAMMFEEKIRKMAEERLVKKCWKEKKNEDKDLYSMEREKYLKERGWSSLGIETDRRNGKNRTVELEQRGKDVQNQEIERKLKEGVYCRGYKMVENMEGPKYLNECRKGKEIKAKARARCGSMENANKYWMLEEERKCWMCGKGYGNWRHYVTECEATRSWIEEIEGFGHEKVKKIKDQGRDKEVIKVIGKIDKELKNKEEQRKENKEKGRTR